MMLLFQSQHLSAQEIRQINSLTEREFNEKTLQKLVTKLSSNFEPYKPDKAILQYLNQHARQLCLDPSSLTNPKDKSNSSDKPERQKSSSSEKRKESTKVLILHLSPILKIKTIVPTNQNDENRHPRKRESTEPIVPTKTQANKRF
jgi:hypothetical protein